MEERRIWVPAEISRRCAMEIGAQGATIIRKSHCAVRGTAVCKEVVGGGSGSYMPAVTFSFRGTTQSARQPVGPLAPGVPTSTLEFMIPAGCFDPDCDFTITVDPDGKVDEANETNNAADGRCIG